MRRAQVSGQTAIKFAEQLWNRDLSDYDPDGPLPEIDPLVGENTIARGRASVRMYTDPIAVANRWRELAAAKGLSLREVVIEVTGRQNFIGTPETVAATIDEYVQADASDGFILVPHITPDGLGRVRRQGGADPAGARRLPHRVRGQHAARAPRSEQSRRRASGSGPAIGHQHDRRRHDLAWYPIQRWATRSWTTRPGRR